MSRDHSSPSFSRRGVLAAGGAAAMIAAFPAAAMAVPAAPRRLSLDNLRTGEKLAAVYWADGTYVLDALMGFSELCRDVRTGDVRPIDPKVFDLAFAIGDALGSSRPIGIVSGYRSPKTNAMLAAKSSGVAHHSLHMEAMALDIRIEGRSARDVGRAARRLRGGGVGLYSKSNFVHIDTGRLRYWGK